MATLFVVATPLGNLGDLSPRAAQTLAQCRVIAAESVERARKLLAHLGLSGKRLISCREANRQRSAREIVGRLDEGQDVALVSDAGTPGVNDPGAVVVRLALEAGHRLCPVAGPSALAAALSVAGLEPSPVVFLGFLPPKTGARRELLQRAGQTGWPLVIFEGPHRLPRTAVDLLETLGDRPLTVARELTKLHEQIWRDTCAGLAAATAREEPRGEYTLVLGPGQAAPAADTADQARRLLVEGLAEGREAPGELARRVAAATGQTRKAIYNKLMELKGGRERATTTPESSKMDAANQEPHERVLSVVNALGLHARAAAKITELAGGFDCQITLHKDGVEAEADSVLAILALDAPKGSALLARAMGGQAHQALAALERLFEDRFGEEA